MPVLPYLDRTPSLGPDCLLAPGSWVVGDARMGSGCIVLFGATVRGDTGDVVVGDEVNVQEGAVVHTETGMTTLIGDRVSIGHQAVVHGATVGADCLIGMGAVVLSGSVIGEGSIIGARALVPEGARIPPGSLVIGIPGRVVRSVSDDERARIARTSAVYERLRGEYRASWAGRTGDGAEEELA